MTCSLSKLGEPELKKIHALEGDLNRPLLAFSCYDVKPADVTEEELSRIKELEKQLGLSLLAVLK
jgi:hypothetical protein